MAHCIWIEKHNNFGVNRLNVIQKRIEMIIHWISQTLQEKDTKNAHLFGWSTRKPVNSLLHYVEDIQTDQDNVREAVMAHS